MSEVVIVEQDGWFAGRCACGWQSAYVETQTAARRLVEEHSGWIEGEDEVGYEGSRW